MNALRNMATPKDFLDSTNQSHEVYADQVLVSRYRRLLDKYIVYNHLDKYFLAQQRTSTQEYTPPKRSKQSGV